MPHLCATIQGLANMDWISSGAAVYCGSCCKKIRIVERTHGLARHGGWLATWGGELIMTQGIALAAPLGCGIAKHHVGPLLGGDACCPIVARVSTGCAAIPKCNRRR